MHLILTILICFSVIQGTYSSTNTSWEHKIRAALLEDYDNQVRPVHRGKKVVIVEFAMKVSRLVKVDNKEQLITVDTWVIQQWENEFLTWNASEYGDVDHIRFTPHETWVPDISLYNNGDDQVNLAGGKTKFVTAVSVNSAGKCSWSGPATFKVSCQLTIPKWPFDEQECELGFGSYTYGKNLLKLKLFKANKQFTNRYVDSGDWDIVDIVTNVTETDHGDCCPFNFGEIVYTIKMRRRPLYYLFYLTIPCVLLNILALSSFLIPAESGERIGFVTTVLLAMTVFLLLVPSFLPETSEDVPILGLNIQITMIIITLVLFANVFVLRVYFKEGTPPLWVQNICGICNRKRKSVQRIHVTGAGDSYPPMGKSAASMAAIELTSESRAGTPPLVEKGEELTWQKVSIKLDYIFFGFFVFLSAIANTVTYTS